MLTTRHGRQSSLKELGILKPDFLVPSTLWFSGLFLSSSSFFTSSVNWMCWQPVCSDFFGAPICITIFCFLYRYGQESVEIEKFSSQKFQVAKLLRPGILSICSVEVWCFTHCVFYCSADLLGKVVFAHSTNRYTHDCIL